MKFISLYGEDGSGKSQTAIGISKTIENSHMLKSCTTKPPRHKDDNEYYFITEKEFKSTEMIEWVTFGGYYYGIQKAEVENNLDKDILIYVGEANGIVNLNEYIVENYPKFNRIKLFMDIPKEVIRENLERENRYTEEQINIRLSRSNIKEDAKMLNLTPDHTITFLNEKTVDYAISLCA